MRHGMYAGTRSWTNWGPKRCRAPKTAIGLAKHALPNATILSRPRASAIRPFAASIPITNSAMPAQHIATTGLEPSRSVARIVGFTNRPMRSESEGFYRSLALTQFIYLASTPFLSHDGTSHHGRCQFGTLGASLTMAKRQAPA